MPWSAGTFSRTNGVFTGPTVWAQDAAVPVNIIATRHDTHDQDIATGLNNCVTIDGLNKPTATISPNADATYALGTTALRWANLYLSASAYLYNGATNAVQLSAGTLTAARAVTFPDSNGAVVIDSAPQTLANKIISDVTLSASVVASGLASGTVVSNSFVGLNASNQLVLSATSAAAGVASVADAANGGLSFSASTGAVTARVNVNDLATKTTPTSSDFVAIYDTAGGVSKKASPASIVAAAGGAGTLTAGTTNTLNPISATNHVQAHGLGAVPFMVVAWMQCVSADVGYSTGDRVYIAVSANSSQGIAVAADATNTVIGIPGTTIKIPDKSSGATATITVGNWEIVAIPYKLT